jgi:hypothetical protein
MELNGQLHDLAMPRESITGTHCTGCMGEKSLSIVGNRMQIIA